MEHNSVLFKRSSFLNYHYIALIMYTSTTILFIVEKLFTAILSFTDILFHFSLLYQIIET